MENFSKEDISWNSHSKYVILTLERILDSLQANQEEISEIKQDLIKSLTKVKEQLREEFFTLDEKDKKLVNNEIEKIESLISKVNTKCDNLKDKEIVPLKIKLAVISIISGGFAGILTSFVIPVLIKLFVG